MSEIVFAKLTQIMHDMLSFNVPVPKIKNLISRYLKQSNMINPDMARDIMIRLSMELKKEEEDQRVGLQEGSELLDYSKSHQADRDPTYS